jgi:hypothetical protein
MGASSVTVNEFDAPALRRSLAACGGDEPAGGGGVLGPGAQRRGRGAEEEGGSAAALGGELEAAGGDAGQAADRRDGYGDAGAGEAFG